MDVTGQNNPISIICALLTHRTLHLDCEGTCDTASTSIQTTLDHSRQPADASLFTLAWLSGRRTLLYVLRGSYGAADWWIGSCIAFPNVAAKRAVPDIDGGCANLSEENAVSLIVFY